MALEKIIYTAKATTTGGREGTSKSDDGKLSVTLAPPKEMGGNGNGTNPKVDPAGQKASTPGGENAPNAPAKLPEKGAADGYKKGGNGGDNGNGKDRLTSKQMQFILSLAQDRNITRNELNKMTLDRYAVMCDFMNRAEASNFITELQSMQEV